MDSSGQEPGAAMPEAVMLGEVTLGALMPGAVMLGQVIPWAVMFGQVIPGAAIFGQVTRRVTRATVEPVVDSV